MTSTTDVVEPVKQVFDCKGPLKGKGGTLAQWLNDTAMTLAEVHREMSALSAESRTVDGRQFALFVYRLRDAKQLRWRMRVGRHTTWQQVAPLLRSLPAGLAQWYERAEEVAQVLNHREQVLRHEHKTILRLVMIRERTEGTGGRTLRGS